MPSPSETPSIHSSNSDTSGIRNTVPKSKQRARSTLGVSPDRNLSSLSLGSSQDGHKSSTKLMSKLRQKRDERRERKAREKGDMLNVGSRSNLGTGDTDEDGDLSRRPSAVESIDSQASIDTFDESEASDNEPISTQGYLTLQPPNTSSSQLQFPITVSTSVDDPARSPIPSSLLSPSDSVPTRRATSPALENRSREASPTPSTLSAASPAGNILGGIFGMGNGRNRAESTATAGTTGTTGTIGTKETTSTDGISERIAMPAEAHNPSSPLRTTRTTPTSSPLKVNTNQSPETILTPPTPLEPTAAMNPPPSPSALSIRRGRGGSLGNMPSKLSQTQFADDMRHRPLLTPTIEVPTPQASPPVGTQGGFFGSMLAAAQTAATQLGNTINTSLAPGQQAVKGKKPGPLQPSPNISPLTTPADMPDPPPTASSAEEKERKRLAVETLGQGELNLASLGIAPERDDAPRGRRPGSRGGSTISKNENVPIGLGLTTDTNAPLDDLHNGEKGLDDIETRSGYATPPTQEEGDTFVGRRRSGSVRSTLGAPARRKRGSSATTNNMPLSNNLATRPTGFAVATIKRNKDFHTLFKSVPENDSLIEDYGCALQKEILLQGRMYVSEGHICFNSNIFGWVTTLVISFDEVVSIEKKMTAVVFPNAIVIQTLHARNVFASFISRDSAYDLLVGIWRMSHPTLRTSANFARLDDGTREDGDGSELDVEEASDDGSEGSEDEGSTVPSASEVADTAEPAPAKTLNGKKSVAPLIVPGTTEEVTANGDVAKAPNGNDTFPGPPTHAVTTCGDEGQHYDKPLCDEIIPVPLGKVFSVIFGDQSYTWMTRLLVEDSKILELDIPNEGKFKEGHADHPGKKTREYSYIRPLGGSIGPKQTKCNITEILDQEDFGKAITVIAETRTPDVPSGGIFKVLTRYCLMWGENNSTRFIVNCTIEWSGKSWLKGPIEKGASDGQINYTKELLAALKREFAAPKAAATTTGKNGKRSKRRKSASEPTATRTVASAPAATPSQNPLSAIIDPLSSMVGTPIAYVITLALSILCTWLTVIIFSWLFAPRGVTNVDVWNEMWVQEERGLWEWLEDRSGRTAAKRAGGGGGGDNVMRDVKGTLHVDWVERQKVRKVEEAEERLKMLKKVVDERLEVLMRVKEYKSEEGKEKGNVQKGGEVKEEDGDAQQVKQEKGKG